MYMRKLRNPTGPITPRRLRNGRFLMTVFADAAQGGDLFGELAPGPLLDRARVGADQDGTIKWGQPESLFYVLPPCEDPRCGIGYPDFVETGSGIYVTETDKAVSRFHLCPRPPRGGQAALSVPQRSPMKIYFVWGFCVGAQGRLAARLGGVPGANGAVPAEFLAAMWRQLTVQVRRTTRWPIGWANLSLF
jgi:hypothetical protein